LFRAGEQIPVHEFHYWDGSENGTDLLAEKADGRSWRCGQVSDTLYAGFPHLHFGGELPLAERFVKACSEYEKHENN
jgi:cobyrinic acid a,c-diamide synthase